MEDIVGQDHITQTLKKAIKNGKLSHAYLLTGPRGVGKTSIARIMAHEVNGLPYTDESIHLDIIEIDAASNRRIDEIRDLRDKVHIAPTSAKYKVYIIDEVHMLTKEAFNALLKTLEEPPAHVIFILATTEIHKLPETIVSRTQRFTFKPITHEDTIKHLKDIAKKENIDIDEEALTLLAEHAGGSFRDSISLLDQVGDTDAKLTKADIEMLIGLAPKESILKLYQDWAEHDLQGIVDTIKAIAELGVSPTMTAKQLAKVARSNIISGKSNNPRTKELIKMLVEVPVSSDPLTTLELALFESIHDTTVDPVKNSSQELVITPLENTKASVTEDTEKIKNDINTDDDIKEDVIHDAKDEPVKQINTDKSIEEWWPNLLAEIKKINNTLYGVIRMAKAELKEDELHLAFKFGFHAKKVADTATSDKLSKTIESVSGRKLKIVATQGDVDIDKIQQTVVDETPEKSDDNIQAITSVFGGAEVLET